MTVGIVLMIVAALGAAGAITYFVLKQKKKQKEYNEQFDFTTKDGIRIRLSPKLADLKSETVEEWAASVVNFWFEKMEWDKSKSLKMLSKTSIFLYDELYLNRAGIKVNGITWPSKFEIEMATLPKTETETYGPFEKVKSLFRHETSHILAAYVGGIAFDNEVHHALFSEVKLGA